MSQIRQSYKN